MRTQEARSLGGCLQDSEAEGGADLLGCCAQAPSPPPLGCLVEFTVVRDSVGAGGGRAPELNKGMNLLYGSGNSNRGSVST